jgi:EF-P beta-lysylation protein EpmB
MTAPISISHAADNGSGWQQVLRDAVRDLDELARLLELPAEDLARVADTPDRFPLLVPHGFVARMQKRNLRDPLLLQVLPQTAERTATPGFVPDPLHESGFSHGGLLQKYAARALLITTAACPVHCRYCFRREFPYQEHLASRDAWHDALATLATQPDIREIILSGGDPLSLSNRRIAELLSGIAELKHVDCVRIHTRFPIMVPERIDAEFEELLRGAPFKVVTVIHCNHANELDSHTAGTLQRLAGSVDLLLNQTVLLRGVNDSAATLENLSRRLFDCGVLPYYLHMLDPVSGSAHFDVPGSTAVQLLDEMRRRLPGYLVPRLVRENPGQLSKTPV